MAELHPVKMEARNFRNGQHLNSRKRKNNIFWVKKKPSFRTKFFPWGCRCSYSVHIKWWCGGFWWFFVLLVFCGYFFIFSAVFLNQDKWPKDAMLWTENTSLSLKYYRIFFRFNCTNKIRRTNIMHPYSLLYTWKKFFKQNNTTTWKQDNSGHSASLRIL